MKSLPDFDRPLPHSVEAERSVLGALFLGSPDCDAAFARLPRVGSFFLPENQTIWRHLHLLHDQGKPLDTTLLVQSLIDTYEIEKAGGVGYVSTLADGLPRVTNLLHYVEIVETKAKIRARAYLYQDRLRKLIAANGNAAELLAEDDEIVSAHIRDEVGRKRIVAFKTGAELAAATAATVDWISTGYVVKGGMTELGAKVKLGKTTLIMELVSCSLDGREFLGRSTRKTPAVYLTEQPAVSFRQAMERAGLSGRSDFWVLPHSEVRGMKWLDVALAAIKECKRVGAELLVVDTLSQFAGLTGERENNSGDALEAMQPLQKATDEGIGVVLIRHERKSGGEVGDSGPRILRFCGRR